jgi:hypothetical protein
VEIEPNRARDHLGRKPVLLVRDRFHSSPASPAPRKPEKGRHVSVRLTAPPRQKPELRTPDVAGFTPAAAVSV